MILAVSRPTPWSSWAPYLLAAAPLTSSSRATSSGDAAARAPLDSVLPTRRTPSRTDTAHLRATCRRCCAVTGSAFRVGGAAPVESTLIDRLPRARVLVAVELAWAALVGLVPLALLAGSLVPLYLVVGVSSVVSSVFRAE